MNLFKSLLLAIVVVALMALPAAAGQGQGHSGGNDPDPIGIGNAHVAGAGMTEVSSYTANGAELSVSLSGEYYGIEGSLHGYIGDLSVAAGYATADFSYGATGENVAVGSGIATGTVNSVIGPNFARSSGVATSNSIGYAR